MKIIDVLVDDLEKIEELCTEYGMYVPTEIKIEYGVLKNSMDVKYQYENVHSNTKDKTDYDMFNAWFDEVSNKN